MSHRPEKGGDDASHLFEQHFAATRSQWASVLDRTKKKHDHSPAAAGWVYANIFFTVGHEELASNLRNSCSFSSNSTTTTSTKQACEMHLSHGTALMVYFEKSSAKCLLQPGRVASPLQEKIVDAGMTGTCRCSMRLPVQVGFLFSFFSKKKCFSKKQCFQTVFLSCS